MRLLFDHQMFAIQPYGGISRTFVELMRVLSREGDCDLHWFRGHSVDQYDISDFEARLSGYWVGDRGPSLGSDELAKRNRSSFKDFCAAAKIPFDVYHPTYLDYECAEIPSARKLVMTVQDMILEKHLGHLPRFRSAIEDKRRLIDRADLLLAGSRHTMRDLIELTGVSSDRIRITPWASRIHEVAPAPLGADLEGTSFLLYVGTRSKYKNFDMLMKAFSSSSWLKENFRVVCFGGTGDFTEPEQAFLRAYGIEERFLFLRGDDSLLRSLYEAASCLVYTSRYEGFGLPPLEAMQCGCPVVCVQTSSLPEVVGDAASFFDPDSAQDLAEVLEAVLTDSERVQGMKDRGRERAKLFSWEETARLTMEAYRDVLGS